MKSIRELDDEIGRSLLKLLVLAEVQWGTWKHDAQTEVTNFENDYAADEFNALAEKIQKARANQVRLLGELLKLQQQAAAARN